MINLLNRKESTLFNIGLCSLYIAFMFPLFIGSYYFMTKVLPFSLKLPRFDLSFSIMHFGFLMLPMESIVGLMAVYQGMRNKQNWTWGLVLIVLGIAGPGDLMAALATDGFPFPIFPLFFGIIGLTFTATTLFKKSERK